MARYLWDLDGLSVSTIQRLLDDTTRIEQAGRNRATDLIGKVLCPLFFQESSRTFINSTVAFQRLGGSVIPLDPRRTRVGSEWKEPIRDFCELLNATCDMVVIRLPEARLLDEYSINLRIPFINAGNGVGVGAEHPMQALVDLYTLQSAGILTGTRLLMIGGRHIRTTRSQAKLFRRFGYEIDMISPISDVPNHDLDEFYKTQTRSFEDLTEVDLSRYGAIYHNGMDEDAHAESDERYNVNTALLREHGFSGKVLHSLPRLQELSTDLDNTEFNLYYEQMRVSQFVFKAIYIHLILEN